jgi:NitT/TauT family transport system substrate-binding protein
MTLSQKTRRGLLGGGLALTTLSAFGAAAQSAPLIMGAGSDPVYTPWFLAAQEKMFDAAKLSVTVQPFTDGGEAMNAMVANQVAITGGAEPSTILRMPRAPLRPLAVYLQSGTYIKLVARKEIASADKIRKFGIVPGSVSEYSTGLTLKKYNMSAASVEFVKSGPPELPALLARGDIDAYFVWEPWPSIGVKQGGHVLLTSADVGYSTQLWVNTSAAWLDSGNNLETAKTILKVLASACEVVQRDPGRSATAVQAMTKIPTATTLGLLKEMECKVRDFTDADFATYDAIADFLAERKITSSRVDYRPSMQRGFYKA